MVKERLKTANSSSLYGRISDFEKNVKKSEENFGYFFRKIMETPGQILDKFEKITKKIVFEENLIFSNLSKMCPVVVILYIF